MNPNKKARIERNKKTSFEVEEVHSRRQSLRRRNIIKKKLAQKDISERQCANFLWLYDSDTSGILKDKIRFWLEQKNNPRVDIEIMEELDGVLEVKLNGYRKKLNLLPKGKEEFVTLLITTMAFFPKWRIGEVISNVVNFDGILEYHPKMHHMEDDEIIENFYRMLGELSDE